MLNHTEKKKETVFILKFFGSITLLISVSLSWIEQET